MFAVLFEVFPIQRNSKGNPSLHFIPWERRGQRNPKGQGKRRSGHERIPPDPKFFRVQKTVPLVNQAFARVTPAIFVVSRGLSSKAPYSTGWNVNSSFSPVLHNTKKHSFWRDKGTVYQRHRLWDPEFWTSRKHPDKMPPKTSLVVIGFLHLPQAWNVFFEARRVFQRFSFGGGSVLGVVLLHFPCKIFRATFGSRFY